MIFLGISLLIDTFHKKVIMENSMLNRKENILHNKLSDIRTLVIGDSHFAAGFNTKHFGHQSYNYATSGENYQQNYYKLKSVLETPNSIKTVILPYDFHSTSSFRNNRITDHSYWGKHIPFLKEAISQKNSDLLVDFVKSKAFSYLGQSNNWKSWYDGHKVKTIKEGVENRTVNFASSNKKQQIANRYAKLQFKDAIVPNTFALAQLVKMITLCKEHNKQPILVSMPVSQNYLTEVAQYQNLEQLEITTNIYRVTKFPEIPYFNFRDSVPSLKFYSDANHLNFEGSRHLSKRLLDAMVSVGIEL